MSNSSCSVTIQCVSDNTQTNNVGKILVKRLQTTRVILDTSDFTQLFEVINSDSSIKNSQSLAGEKLNIRYYLDIDDKNYRYIDESCEKTSEGIQLFGSIPVNTDIKGEYEIALIPSDKYSSIKNIYLWVEPYGTVCFELNNAAYGLLKIAKSDDFIKDENRELTIKYKISLLKSPVAFTTDEMKKNTTDSTVLSIKEKNILARKIYSENQYEWASAIHQATSLTIESELEKKKLLELMLGSSTFGEHTEIFFCRLGAARGDGFLETLAFLGTGLGENSSQGFFKIFNHFTSEEIANNYIEFYNLKHSSLTEWAKKVHKDVGDIESIAQDAYFLGGGEWDYKRDIGSTWGQWNVLGNNKIYENGHAFFYDIWANLNYGFAGNASGFTLEELMWGAGGAQSFDTGAVSGVVQDDIADTEAVREGYELFNEKKDNIKLSDLLNIVEKYSVVNKNPERLAGSWLAIPHANRDTIFDKRCQ